MLIHWASWLIGELLFLEKHLRSLRPEEQEVAGRA